ncbi:hypothetical protein ACJ5H2_09325 [Nocardioides sp. R1-1]|uniref:hypothetical protein n=1 Tax=Nocardioides sp. R1-1 TaxID=3383502 RepID=UPI0038D0CE44
MTTQNMADVADHRVDLEADFANEDETGYIWVWLDEAREPQQIVPGAVLTLRDGEDLAMGQVIDLVAKADGTVVHIELLPGAIEEYQAAIERFTAHHA